MLISSIDAIWVSKLNALNRWASHCRHCRFTFPGILNSIPFDKLFAHFGDKSDSLRLQNSLEWPGTAVDIQSAPSSMFGIISRFE